MTGKFQSKVENGEDIGWRLILSNIVGRLRSFEFIPSETGSYRTVLRKEMVGSNYVLWLLFLPRV